jgi:hypothetical protein
MLILSIKVTPLGVDYEMGYPENADTMPPGEA